MRFILKICQFSQNNRRASNRRDEHKTGLYAIYLLFFQNLFLSCPRANCFQRGRKKWLHACFFFIATKRLIKMEQKSIILLCKIAKHSGMLQMEQTSNKLILLLHFLQCCGACFFKEGNVVATVRV